MPIAETKHLGIPGIAAAAALGLHREAALSATGRENHDTAARAATATRIIQCCVVGGSAVGSEGGGAAEAAGRDDDDAASGCATARLVIPIGVVARTAATTAAHGNAVHGCGEERASLTARAEVRVPGVAAKTT